MKSGRTGFQAPRPGISKAPRRRAGCLARLAGILPLAMGTAQAAEDAAQARSAELSVSVRPVRSLCFQDRIEVTGVLAAREMVEVGVDREGQKVAQVLVEPLEEVSTGQVLARLVRLDEPVSTATGLPVRAPVSGVVIRSGAIVGMPASSRQGPLFRIAAGGDLDLQANVPLSDLAKLSVGQAVQVTPLGATEITGKVRQIDQTTDAASQLGRVRIGLSSGQDLRIGTFARGVIRAGESCGLAVPYSSVTYEAEGTIVHVVNNERIEARQVTLGLLGGDNVEIRSGLTEADLVVVRAGAFVREGDHVNAIRVQEAGEAGTKRSR